MCKADHGEVEALVADPPKELRVAGAGRLSRAGVAVRISPEGTRQSPVTLYAP